MLSELSGALDERGNIRTTIYLPRKTLEEARALGLPNLSSFCVMALNEWVQAEFVKRAPKDKLVPGHHCVKCGNIYPWGSPKREFCGRCGGKDFMNVSEGMAKWLE